MTMNVQWCWLWPLSMVEDFKRQRSFLLTSMSEFTAFALFLVLTGRQKLHRVQLSKAFAAEERERHGIE